MSAPPVQVPLRVLVVAENASVRFGGEAILPYHYFRLLRALEVDTHLVVHARVRDELLLLFPDDHDRLHFVQDQTLQKLFFHIGKLLPHRINESTFGLLNQMLTQRAQRGLFRGLATPGTVVHQPIPVSPRFPSLLNVAGVPLVIGPLNGGMDYPPAFRSAESLPSRLAIAFGRSFADLTNALFPGKRNAAVVLVANSRTRAVLPGGLRGRILELPENGVDLAQWTAPPSTQPDPARFLFIGRLVDWKALDLVLEALVHVPEATLEVVGDGDMRAMWQSQAQQLGLGTRVTFAGWQSQAACAERLAASCALVLPSLYECGGAVVLEAMAMARPVIATAWGGPTDYLDATCGFLIPPTSRAALIAGFAQSMKILIANPTLRESMGRSGQTRLHEHFTWQSKIETILCLYKEISASS